MTRKRYARDTYQEELEAALVSSSESEEEFEEMTWDEKYDIIHHFVEHYIEVCWVRRWVSACDILNLMEEDIVDRDYQGFLNHESELPMCNRMRTIIRNMCISVDVYESVRRIEHVLCGMLQIRNNFEIVVPRGPMHWTRNVNRRITRRA